MIEDEEEINDLEVFDVSEAKIEYHRNTNGTRITILIKDVNAISELKMYLILGLELEKLERRLGICESTEDKH